MNASNVGECCCRWFKGASVSVNDVGRSSQIGKEKREVTILST